MMNIQIGQFFDRPVIFDPPVVKMLAAGATSGTPHIPPFCMGVRATLTEPGAAHPCRRRIAPKPAPLTENGQERELLKWSPRRAMKKLRTSYGELRKVTES